MSRRIRPQPGPQEVFCSSPADIAIYGGSAFGGKLLSLRTPVPTPTGWSTMGDLRPGDWVLSDEGVPTRVTWVSEVERRPEAYELEFDDGARLVADVGHQWVTLTELERNRLVRCTPEWRAARRARRASRGLGKRPDMVERNARLARSSYTNPNKRGSVRTTREILQTLGGSNTSKYGPRANHCIVNPAPLVLPPVELPVDPYVLGAWLGDGTAVNGNITSADPELIASIRARGYDVDHIPSSKYAHNIVGLSRVLREMGLRDNKHIPAPYLRASLMQRLALLQGLCDTDGYADPVKGCIEFTTTRPALRDGMLELLATLGIKPGVCAGEAKLHGRVTGPKWRITFYTHLPAFELPRKLANQRRDNAEGRRNRRFIVAVRPAPREPMRCIAVDAPSHCYLVGREMIVTHNSWALAFEAARYVDVPGYSAVIFRRTTPELQGGGSIWEESKGLYVHMPGARRRESPTLQWVFPGGSSIEFRHLQHVDTVHEHQGKQYASIFFDEITHFEASQFWYMLSRLRSATGVPRRVRGTCNPDPDSFVRELIDWWIGPDGLAIDERSGVIRYLARVDERIVWGDSPADVYRQAPHAVLEPGAVAEPDDPRVEPLSFTFIRAKATDNKIGMQRDPGYLSRLATLPGAERERLLFGNWNARDTAGDYYNRTTFPVLEHRPDPKSVVRRVRFWDKAATSVSTTNPDPDWTRGALVALLDDGSFVLEDLQSMRAGPGEVEALIRHTAETDGRTVEVGCYLDPAQAGRVDEHHMRRLLEGFAFQTVPTTRHLTVYAKAWVTIAGDGRLAVVRAPYLHDVWRELEGYPFARHDDIVAAMSGAMQLLTGPAFTIGYMSGADHRHPLDGAAAGRDDDDDDWGDGTRGGGGSSIGRGRGAYA